MVKRVVVGAHYGLRDWLVQRITAILMIVYTFLMVGIFLAMGPSHESFQALFAKEWVKIFSFMTFFGLAWHAWVGVRDIWMDYIQPTGIRMALHVLTLLFLFANLIWAARILWGA